jgi:hypothetical protein
MMSRVAESPPSALTKPDVKLSPHPAPTIWPPAPRLAANEQTVCGHLAERRVPTSTSTHVRVAGISCISVVPMRLGLIEMTQDWNTFRTVKPSVVVHPDTPYGIDESGKMESGRFRWGRQRCYLRSDLRPKMLGTNSET